MTPAAMTEEQLTEAIEFAALFDVDARQDRWRKLHRLHCAMKAGRLSYAKDAAGERRIEVAELERVFGLKPAGAGRSPVGNGAIPGNDAYASQGNDTHAGEQAALQRLLDDRERTIADLRESIRDLRQRLDAEVEERRKLIMLLTDRRPWWRRW
jgi:hypothetical protein